VLNKFVFQAIISTSVLVEMIAIARSEYENNMLITSALHWEG